MLLNYDLYKTNLEKEEPDFTNIDYLLGIIHSINDWEPPCSLTYDYLLMCVLSYNELIQYEHQNPSLVDDYILLISELFTLVNTTNSNTIESKKALNYFFNLEDVYRSQPQVLYKFLANLYIKGFISSFIKDKKDFFKEIYTSEYRKEFPKDNDTQRVHQLLILLTIESNYNPKDLDGLNQFLKECQPAIWTLKGILGCCIETTDKVERLNFSFENDYNFETDSKQKIKFIISMFENCVGIIANRSSDFFSNEYDAEIDICYHSMVTLLTKIVNKKSSVIQFLLFGDKVKVCSDLFLYRFHSSNDNHKKLKDEILSISFSLFQKHKHPFIFKFLYEILINSDSYEFFIEVFEQIVKFIVEPMKLIETCIDNGRDRLNMNYNFGNIIVLLFSIEDKRPSTFREEKLCSLFFSPILETLQKTFLFFSKICFQVYQSKYQKSVNEMIFDILYNLYIETKNIQYFEKIYELYVYSKSKDINNCFSFLQNNKTLYHNLYYYIDSSRNLDKNESIFVLEGKQLETDFYKLIEKEDDSCKIITNINYSLYFLVKLFMYNYSLTFLPKEEIDYFKKLSTLLVSIAEVTCRDLKELKNKNSKKKQLYYENKSELFLYDIIKDIFEKNYLVNDNNFQLVKNEFELEIQTKLKKYDIFLYVKYLTISTCKRKGVYLCDLIKNNTLNNKMNMISSKTFFALGRTVNSIKTKQTTWSDGALCNCDKNSSGNASFISKNGSNLKSASSFSSQNTITNTCSTNISPCSINENKAKKKLLIIDIEDCESFETIEPKAQLLLSHFSVVFKDFYFNNKTFEKIKRQYALRTGASLKNKKLSYPSKLKNYSNGLDPPQFLTQDFDFFDHKYFNISHSYCIEIKKYYPVKKIKLFKKPLPQMKIISHFDCELLGNDISLFGHMNITKFLFFFENATQNSFVELSYKEKMKYILHDFSMENSHKEKRILFYPNEIKEIIIRRYLLLWQGVEILMKNGKSYFFNFFHSNHLQTFFSKIEKYFKITVITNLRENFAEQGFQGKWKNNKISSYEFLLAINKYASRSFIEPTQYPVFPWVLLEYQQMNSNNIKVSLHYRDFKYPVACQTEDKRETCMQRYKDSIDNEFKSHLGTHYSTSSFIYYYLMRCNPYTHSLIKLQGDNFENTNRMFFSIDETLGILDSSPDCRELIPEFFSKIDFMINLNCNAFGNRRNGELVDDLLFENHSSLSLYIDFIMKHRNLLENSIVKTELPHWINFIFGPNQLSGGEKACNIFQKETYEEKVNLENNIIKLEKEKQDEAMIVKETQDLITTITSFGMTPYKLLEKNLVYEGNEVVDDYDDFPELLGLKDNEKRLLQKECCYFSFDNKCFYFLNKKKNTVDIEILPTKDIKVGKGKKIKDDHSQIYSCNGVKLFRKIKDKKGESFSSDGAISYYLFNPKYAFTTICNSSFLVSVRYKDNSISIQKIEQKTKEKPERILNNDFISSITSNNDNVFFTGSLRGRLTEWQYDPINKKCNINKSIMAHENKINAIELYAKYNIIATAGDDNYIYIRKIYNFELLVPIKIKKKYIITYMKFSHFDFLYVMCYNTKKNMMRIFGYTLSGLLFAKSKHGHYNNFCFTKSGNLIVGNCNDEKEQVKIMRGSNLELIKGKELVKEKNSKALGWFDFCMDDNIFFLGYKTKDFYIIEIIKEEDLESFK